MELRADHSFRCWSHKALRLGRKSGGGEGGRGGLIGLSRSGLAEPGARVAEDQAQHPSSELSVLEGLKSALFPKKADVSAHVGSHCSAPARRISSAFTGIAVGIAPDI